MSRSTITGATRREREAKMEGSRSRKGGPPARVVNVYQNHYDVFIGRGRPSAGWGNPFRVGIDGDRAEVIKMYEAYIRSSPELMARLGELEGKTLGCFCRPKRCHGDVLVKLLRERKGGGVECKAKD